MPESRDPVTHGKSDDRALGGKGRAGNSRAILYAAIAIVVLALCAGAYYVASSKGPSGTDDSGIIPVPGSPDLYMRPVNANFENGSQIYVLENKRARDPVYGLVMSFIQDDGSVYGAYEPGHTCSSFAVELIDNAERCFINAHLVILTLSNSSNPHAIVAFNTTDRGTVYVDNTGVTQSLIDQNYLVGPRIASVTPGSRYIRHYIGYDFDEDPGLGVVQTVTFLN